MPPGTKHPFREWLASWSVGLASVFPAAEKAGCPPVGSPPHGEARAPPLCVLGQGAGLTPSSMPRAAATAWLGTRDFLFSKVLGGNIINGGV